MITSWAAIPMENQDGVNIQPFHAFSEQKIRDFMGPYTLEEHKKKQPKISGLLPK